MSQHEWTKRISQITPQTPIRLDDSLEGLDPRTTKPGTVHFPSAAANWAIATPFRDPEMVAIGVRVTDDTQDKVQLAMKLAQMAAEKDAEPIVLSHIDHSGLARFGFRVERIAGATQAERDTAEAQVIRFWNIVLVI